MLYSSTDTTPVVVYFDLEVHEVVESPNHPGPFIKQISFLRRIGDKEEKLDALIKPPSWMANQNATSKLDPNLPHPPSYDMAEFFPVLEHWINKPLDGKRCAVLTAHVCYKHDMPIFKKSIENLTVEDANGNKTKVKLPEHWKFFCTHYLSACLGFRGKDSGLVSLCSRYSVNTNYLAHDSRNDTRMLADLFKAMVGNANFNEVANAMILPISENPVITVATIIQAANGILSPNNTSNENATINPDDTLMVVYDTETNGLFGKGMNGSNGGENPRITELAAVVRETGDFFTYLVDPRLDKDGNPEEGITIPDIVVDITQISLEIITKAGKEYQKKTGKKMNFVAIEEDFKNFLTEQKKKTGKTSVIFAHYNGYSYDNKVLEAERERCGLPKEYFKSVDVLWLSRSIHKGYKPQPKGFHKLTNQCERNGIKFEAHRALGDAGATLQLYSLFTHNVPLDRLREAEISKHLIINIRQLIKDYDSYDPYKCDAKANAIVSSAPKQILPAIVSSFPQITTTTTTTTTTTPEEMEIERVPTPTIDIERLGPNEFKVTVSPKNRKRDAQGVQKAASTRPQKKRIIIPPIEDDELFIADNAV